MNQTFLLFIFKQVGWIGSDPWPQTQSLSGKTVAAGYTRASNTALFAGKDRYGATCAFLRWCASYASSPRATKYELNWPAISLLGGELALPISGWPASAALIGNSDTTAKPASWQVDFRGIEWPKIGTGSSAVARSNPCRHKKNAKAQNAAPNGAAFRSCTDTGLPNLSAGGYPPHLLQVIRPVYPL